jgi:multiple sugar transport system ATP-binding protein
MRKYAKADIDARVTEASEILGIRELLDRKPKALSGGQRQRVALGRAIVRRPKVFLFDEPLSNLDANLRVQMRTEISRLHKQLQTTMIYVTHDQIEAMSMGDRIVVMEKGVVQQVDSPLTIYNRPANRFVAGFIGSPTMNFFNGSLSAEGGVSFQEGSGAFRFPLGTEAASRLERRAESQVTLGIRPEHIAARAQNGAPQPLAVNVEVTEPVGNEIFIYFTVAGTAGQYVCRIPSDIQPEAGRPWELFFDTSKFHFFESGTGRAL